MKAMLDKKWMPLVYGAILSVLAALITAMLSGEKSVTRKTKTFIAGVACGIMLQLYFMDFSWLPEYKNLITILSSAFVSTMWPILQDFYSKYLAKYFDKTLKNKESESDTLPDDQRK